MTPDEYTIKEFFLEVGDGHRLYVHDWGNKQAKHPIIFVNGGPGGSCREGDKQNFNPEKHRVIFYDQRGSGKSIPKGELKDNNTQKLIEDIEKLIKELNLDSVVLCGGSWGSCLSLLFGIKYPKRVKGMVLNGIFTARENEIGYLDNGGFKTFYPDIWERYCRSVPDNFKDNPSRYHYQNAFSSDEELVKKSAYAYSAKLEGPLVFLDDRFVPEKFVEFDPSGTLIEMHFLKNNCFIPEGYIFNNASKLKMPIWLVQGRYDMVCPPLTAYELNKLLPNSELIWSVSGHVASRESWSVIKALLDRAVL